MSSDYSVRGVCETLQQVVSASVKDGGQRPVCLILDGLSVLLSVGVPLCQVMALVHACIHMLTSSNGPCQVSMCMHATCMCTCVSMCM